MNTFNRAFTSLLLAVLGIGSVVVIALAWTIPNESIDGLRDAVDWLDDNNQDEEKIILTAILGAIAFLSLLALSFEVMPRSSKTVKVADLRVGDASLSTAAIGQRIEEAVNQVPHVSDVRANVKSKRKGVAVAMDLHVDPEANLAEVTDQACETARDVLANRVHVALAQPPTARVFYRELRLRRGQGARAGATTAPAGRTTATQPASARDEQTSPRDGDGAVARVDDGKVPEDEKPQPLDKIQGSATSPTLDAGQPDGDRKP